MNLALEPALLLRMTHQTSLAESPVPANKRPQKYNQNGRFATQPEGLLADSRTGHAKRNASEPHL